MSQQEKSRTSRTVEVRGRKFQIERIAWRGTSGLSYDVTDVETKLCLTPESFDDRPTVEDIEQLLDNLMEDLAGGTLDFYFSGEDEVVRTILLETRVAQIMDENRDQPGFDRESALAAIAAEEIDGDGVLLPSVDVTVTVAVSPASTADTKTGTHDGRHG